MNNLLSNSIDFLNSESGAVLIIGGFITFVVKLIYSLWIKLDEKKDKDFRDFHELIKLLNQSDTPREHIKLERQAAVVFELRRYKKYYPVTKRLFDRRLKKASDVERDKYYLLYKEMELAINYINKHI